jgi:hypothetical protein
MPTCKRSLRISREIVRELNQEQHARVAGGAINTDHGQACTVIAIARAYTGVFVGNLEAGTAGGQGDVVGGAVNFVTQELC